MKKTLTLIAGAAMFCAVLRAADEISSKVTGTETAQVQTVEKIERVLLTGDTVEITIAVVRVLPDGAVARIGSRTVSRKRSAIAAETVTVGGITLPASALTSGVVALAEKWKAEDDAINN
jgi:hypothetical protein